MLRRPSLVRNQDRIEIRLTKEREARVIYTFVETLNEATLAERPMRVYSEAAKERRLLHVINRMTDDILGTAVVQPSSDGKAPPGAEVGGLLVHPGARGFGIAAHLLKVMMVYAVKESGRDQPGEEYLGHVVEGNVPSMQALLGAGFRSTGIVELHRGDIDAVIDHMIEPGASSLRLESFAFDRQAVDGLMLDLWRFAHEDRGEIVHADSAGDIRVTLDFSHVIPHSHLDEAVRKNGQSAAAA